MKNSLQLFATLCLTFVVLGSLSSVIAQKNFTSDKGKFSVNFFGEEPQYSSSDVPTDVGNVVMHSYMYEKSQKEGYMIVYIDYPQEYVGEGGADYLLRGGMNGALSSLGISEVDVERNIRMKDHPGLYFAARGDQYYVMYELYLVGNRLYQVAILTDGMYPDRKNSDAFFGSFTLND